MPLQATLNLHAGRLPAYRGGSLSIGKLINGEAYAGVSVIRVDEGIDTGPIMAEASFPIGPCDTIVQLHQKPTSYFHNLRLARYKVWFQKLI